MAATQHDPSLSTERISNIQNTPVNRPDTSNPPTQSDENLQRYTCLYFGYASNLSPITVKQRCPDSLFISLGRLPGWRWMINETGYANIVPSTPDDEVWGTLCFLSARDEAALDESEGVPWMYEKLKLKVKRVPQVEAGEEWGGAEAEQEVEATAYVDRQRTTDGKIEPDYVVWVNKSIKDASACGLPVGYADKHIAKYLPKKTDGDLPDQQIMMVRTMQFGERSAGLVPRGFASWSRG